MDQMEQRLLQEQLARLRRSWRNENHQQNKHAAKELSTSGGSAAAAPFPNGVVDPLHTGIDRQWLALRQEEVRATDRRNQQLLREHHSYQQVLTRGVTDYPAACSTVHPTAPPTTFARRVMLATVSTDTDTSGLPSSSSGRSVLNAPLRATTVSVPLKRPAPPTPLISAPPAKKTPKLYFAFCREQRPLLPPFLTNGEREKCLSLRWKDLSVAEKATYGRAQGGGGTLAPVPAPTMAPAMASVASTSQQATAEAMSSTDRWSLLWKVEEAKASCRVASAGTSAMTQHAPPPALVVPSNTPVTLVFAAPHHSVAPSSFLAPPDYLLPPNPFAVSAGMELEIHARQLELAELLEHMTEEEALEALGAEMCCWGVDPTNTAPGIRRA